MRQSAHSLRLAVSLLLGAVFVATPMANTAFASGSDPLLTADSLTQPANQTPCKNILSNSLLGMSSALVPSQFERIDTTALNRLVITAPKNALPGSLMSVQTVLKKATEDDLDSDIVVTPSPAPSISVMPSAPVSSQGITPNTTGSVLNADVLFGLVNAARAQYGLPAFQKNDQLCAVASSRAPEIDGEIWVTHTMHAGFYGRNLPFWATENLISMGSEQAALNWWLNSPVHRAAVLGSWQYACVACAGRSCSMIFSNLEPKYGVSQPVQQATPTPTQAAGSSSVPTVTTTLPTQ